MENKKAEYLGLAHICVYTRDIEESIRFYRDCLHFELAFQTVQKPDAQPDGFFPLKYALIRLGACIIELLEPSGTENLKIGEKGILDHFAVEVRNIETVAEELKAKGVVFDSDVFVLSDLLDVTVKGAFIKGPSGEAIELFELMG